MHNPCTVGDIYRVLDAFAPFSAAMEGDNVGLLVGKMDRPVDTVLTALDATPAVVREAERLGAQLLVTHHPVMFSPLRRLDEAEPEAALLCSMIRANVSMIAAHTNLDLAAGGVNDSLADKVRWKVSEVDGFLRLGTLCAPSRLDALEESVSNALQGKVLRYGHPARTVFRFAICSGSGGSEIAHAAQRGAEVFLTGEIKHDKALEAMARGMAVLAAGHRATEICAADLLAKHLLSALDTVEYKVRVYVSAVNPFEE